MLWRRGTRFATTVFGRAMRVQANSYAKCSKRKIKTYIQSIVVLLVAVSMARKIAL